MTAIQLRKDIYRVIEQVFTTGEPVEITCRGEAVMIVPKTVRSRMARLKKRPVLICSPEELLKASWEGTWKPFI